MGDFHSRSQLYWMRIVQGLFLATICSSPPAMADAVKAGDFVAMCGDSITAQKLYSLYIEDYLVLCRPAENVEAMQFGWGGEKAPSLLERMDNDVLQFKPSVVTLCYGMNDGFYAASTPETLEKYRGAMQGIVSGLKKSGVRYIIIGTPGAVDTDSFKKLDPAIYNNTLEKLGVVAKEIAAKEQTGFADVHATMLEAMAKAKAKYGNQYLVAGSDGIHPNRNGHLIMAYAFLKALGCDGEIGTISYDMQSGAAEASTGHKIIAADRKSIEIESSRYPFCFSGKPSQQDANLGMTQFIPFNEELNRFKLIVKNPVGKMVKVTWGTASKEFSADDATRGINLAAEFPENPFSACFAEAELKIREKQFAESPLSKELLHSLPEWRKSFPDEKDTLVRLADVVLQRGSMLRKQTTTILVPVKHKIVVESF